MNSRKNQFSLFFLLIPFLVLGQYNNDSIKVDSKKKVFYAKPGFQFQSLDDNYKLLINLRVQLRGFLNFDDDPTSIEDFESLKNGIDINRSRVKIGGNVFKPWMKYYFEYDLVGLNQLDFRFYMEKWSFLKFKAGQWKSRYSVERMISSGKQETIERSIVNRPFTIDRQIGASIYGNLSVNDGLNFSYWVSAFIGTGRGNLENDDDNLMYMSRLQWNINGVEVKYSGSDLKFTEKFTSYLAIAGVTNQSKYTRFSTSGGGYLEGYEDAEDGQYRVNQFLIEASFKYRGWYFQQELHWKEIDDKIYDASTTHLTGHYAQLGYMVGKKVMFLPEFFELYGRHARYNPNRDVNNDLRKEYTIGVNYFISGHNNKLSLEYSHLDYESIDLVQNQTGNRVRLQWDFSF